MRLSPFVLSCAALAVVASCGADSTSPPLKPASMAIVGGSAQSATVGSTLTTAPTFQVLDDKGAPLSGIAFAVDVHGGVLTDTPRRTSAGPTSVGTWTLATTVGVDTITVTVDGLQPLVIAATATVGAASKIVASTPTTLSARVGDAVPAFTARLTDAFGNGVPSATITASLTGGGTAPASMTTDANGTFTVAAWQLGTVAGQNALTLTSGQATISYIATLSPGDPSQVLVAGADQKGRAGAAVSPIVLRSADKYGNVVPARTASFALMAGGGSLAATSATPATDGSVTLPTWTLGRTTLPQVVRATIGSLTQDISVNVASDYKIDIRFFGPDMTPDQKALFTNAAARIQAIITGDVPDIAVTNLDASAACGVTGLPVMNETIDDLVIYASVQPIDGPGKILAESGPCVFRNASQGYLSAVGVMLFDSDDLAKMQSQGTLQDVITHEMLHSVGVGTLWQDHNLLYGAGTPGSMFTGLQARQGCSGDGGVSICATSVPVENNGVIGTADSHWRESTFGSELMTGYVNLGGMPLSAITVGSLADLGYVVNPFAADPYIVPGTGATGNLIPVTGAASTWERQPPAAVVLGASPNEAPHFIRRP